MVSDKHESQAALQRIEQELNVLGNLSAHYAEESRNFEIQKKKSNITQRVVSALAPEGTLYRAVGKCFVGTTRDAVLQSEAASVEEFDKLIESIKTKREKADESIAKAKAVYSEIYTELVKAEN